MSETLSYLLMAWSDPQLLMLTALGTFAGIYIGAIPGRVVQGNLDPLALFGPPALVEKKARAIVAAGRKARAHIFNLGHGISRHTDPAIARLLVDTVHAA